MKMRQLWLPFVLAVGFGGYIALYPGRAYSEPRMANSSPTLFGQQAAFTIDPVHSSISFEITHLGIARIHGRFNKFAGKLNGDAKDLTKLSVEFTAQVDSVDTAVAARDTHLRTADFFEVANFPELTFKSTKVKKAKNGYIATGNLTMKDKTKEISIPFKHYGPVTVPGPGGPMTRIGIIAEPVVLKRSDFGVGSTAPLSGGVIGLSDELTVRLSIEAMPEK